MFSLMIGLFILMILFWIGFVVTGALLSACIWLFIKLPIAIVLSLVGVVLCCTIILLPVGAAFLRSGTRFLLA